MKNTLFILLFLLTSFIGNTQCGSYYIYESFGSALPTQQGTWSQASITFNTVTLRTGTNNLSFNASGDFIRTPIIPNPGVVTFWYRRSGTSSTHGFVVETSPDNLTWTTRNTYSGTMSTTYVQRTVDLTSLSLTNVYIRIRDTRPSGTTVWYLEDLGISSTVSTQNTLIPILGACSQTLTSSLTYQLSDDGGPAGPSSVGYSNSIDRTITLTPSDNTKKLNLSFSHLDLETTYDYLYVYDGPNTSSTLLATLNGTTLPSDISATNSLGQLTIRWTTDVSNIGSWGGFLINVTSISLPTPSCISTPTTPTNGGTNISLTPTITWPTATYASNYDVYFGTTLPGTPTINTTSTSYSPGTLLPGTTYYWKIIPKNSIGSPVGCTTWSFTTLSPPINDNPSGAILLTIGNTVSYSTYTNLYATNTTTETTPTCASYTGEDVWFKVVLPQYMTSLDFDTQVGDITDGGMAIYRGTPGSLVEIQCDDDSSPNGLMSYISRTDFMEYETIYIRIWEYNGGTTGTFGISVTSPQPLPVEMLYFDGTEYSLFNILQWSTASEYNSDYFKIERSTDGEKWDVVGFKTASGNSNTKIDYNFSDLFDDSVINYYRLKQYDYDGQYKIYGPISLDNTRENTKIIKYVNVMGQEVSPTTEGLIFEVYEDGTMRKIIR